MAGPFRAAALIVLAFSIAIIPAGAIGAAKPVVVSKPRVDVMKRTVTLVGSVEPEAKVNVFSKVSGRVEKVLVEEGQPVRRGDPLAAIERYELELALRQAEAAVASAEANLEQARRLAKVKAESQLKQAEAALTAARAGLEQVMGISEATVQARIKQAEAGLEALKANLERIKRGARPEEIKRMEAMVEQAKASMENARENYERMSALYEQGVISKQTMDGVEMQYKVAKAQYEAALQQLEIVRRGAREEEIRAMEAQVRQAEANLELAKLYARTRSWEKDIKLAESKVQQAEAALELARASWEGEVWKLEVKLAESQLKQAEAAMELAKKRLEEATVRAPIDGVISKRMAEVGAMAAPTVPMFEIVKADRVKVIAAVSESEIPYLREGMPATVRVVTGEFEGRVDFVSPVVDPKTRSVKIKIWLDNPDGRIKPGMSADVILTLEIRPKALLVPRTALLTENGESFLFVVESGRAVKRRVKVGLTDEWNAEIIEGIGPEDLVVVEGGNALEEGDPVRIEGRGVR